MHVSKIELQGFKSFGNIKVCLPLSKGFTAIVGPNGSGKSNIIDALCFVLGGMSAKTMRAERFSDLLFNGGNGQRPAPFTEVSLHFDNEDGALPVNSKVVAISRRVDRNGNCVYRMNKKRASRQEIIDMLAQNMSSPGGYNFVMQGDIDRFIKMNPIDRRGIIDDLAGVAEYDEKKQRSLAELQRVETNLNSMDAVLREISGQMERLRSERESAIRYGELNRELEHARTALLNHRRATLKRELSLLRKRIKAKEEELRMLRNKHQDILSEVTDHEQRAEHLNRLIEGEQEVGALTEAEKIRERLKLLDETLGSTIHERTKIEDEIAQVSAHTKKNWSQDERVPLEKIASLSSKFDDLHARFNALVQTFDLKKSRADAQEMLQEFREILGELHSVLSVLSKNLRLASQLLEGVRAGGGPEGFETKSQLHHLITLEATRARLDNDLKRLQQQVQESRAELDRAAAFEMEERSKIKALREEREGLRAKTSGLKREAKSLGEAIERLNDELQSCRVEDASLRSQLESTGEESRQIRIEIEIPQDVDPAKLKSKIENLEAELNALGLVNPKAIQEFREVECRYNSEKLKHDKLMAEKQAILDFMREIDEKKKEVFMQTFNEISKHFSEIFGELSPGGVARLVLENEGNPFDGGLEIEAKPAGKKIARVEGISGGEKALTALAFIFALQRFRPTTFYVLDEIDAHLDPQNLHRVAELVRRSARESQVILVTLRDSMMSAADRLFGVTMDKNGVSHLFSVELAGLAA